jgi:hypothetical protein
MKVVVAVERFSNYIFYRPRFETPILPAYLVAAVDMLYGAPGVERREAEDGIWDRILDEDPATRRIHSRGVFARAGGAADPILNRAALEPHDRARRHGYLAELTVNSPQGAGRWLNASLRVPAAELDAALVDFRQLGASKTNRRRGEDVTRATPISSRVSPMPAIRNSVSRRALARTGELSDVLDVESRNPPRARRN